VLKKKMVAVVVELVMVDHNPLAMCLFHPFDIIVDSFVLAILS
jgi:hypothetical protein